jgi:hypothetical protein
MSQPVTIYLDTNLWNVLCDTTDPQVVLSSLNANCGSLVLGSHTVFELAKTFLHPTDERVKRGKDLFSYLKHFVDHGVLCTKDNSELLAAEMWAIQLRKKSTEVFLDPAGFSKVKTEVDLLASGVLSDVARSFLRDRSAFSSSSRTNQGIHLAVRTDVREAVKRISVERLPNWLRTESLGIAGQKVLVQRLVNQFPGYPLAEYDEWATALQMCPGSRMARALIRADLYYNWRCAHRGSNPKDLIDDMFHVLNSIYCDVYATAERKQTEYLGLLLASDTRVAIFDGSIPIDAWLQTYASETNKNLVRTA